MSVYMATATPLPIFLGVCKDCERPIRIHDEHHTSDHVMYPCPECGQSINLERLYGTVNMMECDSRCMGAAGPSCSCACGGINHGGAWQETGEILADALAKYRAELAKKAEARERKAMAERKRRDDAFALWREDNEPTVTELLSTDWLLVAYPNEFLADLSEQLRDHKPLSPRQIDAAKRTLAKRHVAAEREVNRKLNTKAIPEGRQEVEGTIVGTFRVQDNYSYTGGEILHIVVDTGEFVLKGTCPRSLILVPDAPGSSRLRLWADHDSDFKGRKVRFSAILKAGNELGVGYFKRPTKAEFVN